MTVDDSGRDHAASVGRKWPDPLLALLAGNALWGGVLGVGFVAGALVLDLGHLRHLLTFSADGALALGLLTLGSIITFASVAMGGAVMMIRRDKEGPAAGRRALVRLVPVRVMVAARRRGRSGHTPSE